MTTNPRAARRPGAHLSYVLLGGLAVLLLGGTYWYSAEAVPARQLLRVDPDAVPAQGRLMRFAVGRGAKLFGDACASCHGARAQGDATLGVPNLADQEWLYGTGTVAEIERTVAYGIRSHGPKSWNLAVMPAYARPVPSPGQEIAPLTPPQINDIVEFLMSLHGESADAASAARGHALFTGDAGCFDCHSQDARGDPAIGAPDLTDRVWLYGDGSRASIADAIAYGRGGACPSHADRLTPAEIREVALYVYDRAHRPSDKEAKQP